MNKLQIAGKINMSTVNGNGIRYCLFLSGCPFNCPECHNLEAKNYDYGIKEDIVEIFNDIYKKRHYLDGVSISGGEPTEQSITLLKLLKLLKAININVWMWSGYTFTELEQKYSDILNYVDTVIDGCYQKDKPTKKPHRGSDNQIRWEKIDGKWNKID